MEPSRLRLNLLEVPNYQIFEGEIIVAEGYMDAKKFNVNRIHKPKITSTSSFTSQQLQYCNNNYKNKALQTMVACGPYTVSKDLSYDALKDLMAEVRKEQPHALILTGPFVSQNNEQVQSGDISFQTP